MDAMTACETEKTESSKALDIRKNEFNLIK